MKKYTILFWVSTIIIVLLEGVMPVLTSNTELAKEGIRHLGYPDYFRVMITVFKVAGAIVLIVPAIPARYKEWAYAGFGIDFIAASFSHANVDGFASPQTFFPLVIFIILIVSYACYHKLIASRFNLSLEKIKVTDASIN